MADQSQNNKIAAEMKGIFLVVRVISTFIGIYLFNDFDCSAVLREHCDIGGLYQVAIPGLSLGHRCVKAASDNSGASSRLADAPGGSQNTP